jgi:hypothetical protein
VFTIGENIERTYARLDHPRAAVLSDRRGCSLIKVVMPNSRDGHARYLSSHREKASSEVNYHSKGQILTTYLLRVTMISPERNKPDELAPSIKQFER